MESVIIIIIIHLLRNMFSHKQIKICIRMQGIKSQKSLKNCSTNYDKCTLHANMAQEVRVKGLTEQYGSFSSTFMTQS